MVGATVTPGPITAVGDVFTMDMVYRAGDFTEHYQVDNHVTVLEAPHCVEWAVAPAGKELLGWRWRYEFEPAGPSRTRVRLIFDWAGTPEQNIRRFGVPLLSEDQLADSLELLAAALGDV